MKIGVFDSGLGGLAIAQAIGRRLPDYDLLYLGDTRRVPYGNRSQEAIHQFTSEALAWLFARDCHLVILACNTASAEALRKSQQEYLPVHYPERRVLGVVIPAAEAAIEAGAHRVGVLATSSTVESGAFDRELRRQHPGVQVFQAAAPLLVPLVEADGLEYLDPILGDYLNKLPADLDALILGCTHYTWLKEAVRARTKASVIAQDEVVPAKLEDYLRRHPEHDRRLGKNGERRYCVTDLSASYLATAERLAGQPIPLEKVDLSCL